MSWSGSTATSSGAFNLVPFDTINYDPNGNCTTGASAKYTVPVNGIYLITAACSLGNVTTSAIVAASIYKNGAEFMRGIDFFTTTTTGSPTLPINGQLSLVAGDTIQIALFM